MNFRKWILLCAFLGMFPTSAFAERWFRVQPQPVAPKIYNARYVNVSEPHRGLLVTYYKYEAWDNFYGGWVTHSREVSAVPLSTPVKTEPKKAEPVKVEPAKVEPAPAKAEPVKTEPVAPTKKPVVPPTKEKVRETAPSISVPKSVFIPAPKAFAPLVASLPAAARSVEWGTKVSPEQRNEMQRLVDDTRYNLAQWQSDFLDRFSKCTAGFCEAKRTGTFEELTVPFQVAMGRVRLLKQETDYLYFLLNEEKTEPSALIGHFVRTARRFEAMEALLDDTAGEQHRPYYEEMREQLAGFKKLSDQWDPYDDKALKIWVLRWQLLAIDTEVWLEHAKTIEDTLGPEARKSIAAVKTMHELVRDKLGSEPWLKTLEEQERFATLLIKSGNEIYSSYDSVAALAARRDRQAASYLGAISFLGANESLRVYAYTIQDTFHPEAEETAKAKD